MENNKLLVKKFVEELWNERKLDVAEAIFDESCHTHQLRSGDQSAPVLRGPSAIRAHIADWLSSFPDIKVTVEQSFTEGDRVFSQLAMDGTHSGPWLRMPPTGKRVNIRMVTIHRVQNNKIIEDWVLADFLGLFQQLGALPSTEEIITEFVHRQGALA